MGKLVSLSQDVLSSEVCTRDDTIQLCINVHLPVCGCTHIYVCTYVCGGSTYIHTYNVTYLTQTHKDLLTESHLSRICYCTMVMEANQYLLLKHLYTCPLFLCGSPDVAISKLLLLLWF